jgi:outer membrane protein assembly factor BamB
MNVRVTTLVGAALGAMLWAAPAMAENWPQFRGPTGQGVSTETNLPLKWSATENVAWKTPMAGDGWSSPIVWDKHVFVTAAREKGTSCHVVALDRDSGKVLWDVPVFKQDGKKIQERNSFATPTPVTDGRRVYAFFGGGGAVAVDFSGKVVWTNTSNPFYSQHGLGSSPILYKDLLLMPWDHSIRPGPGVDAKIGWQTPWDQAYVWALDKNTGKERYKAKRGASRISHMTPHIVEVDGKPQLISAAGDVINAFEPETGKPLWWVKTGGEGTTPSPVFADGMVFSSSGFGTAVPYEAIRAHRLGGGSGNLSEKNLVWEQKRGVPKLPSFLAHDGLLYAVRENGFLQVMNTADGEIVYNERLNDGTYAASPVLADGRIYILADNGNTTVVQPGREFKELAHNELNEPAQASMAVSNGRLFIRTAKHLYCIK